MPVGGLPRDSAARDSAVVSGALPAPLVWPAIGLMLGIIASEYGWPIGSDRAPVFPLVLLWLLVVAVGWAVGWRMRRPALIDAAVVVLAFGVGFTRHRAAATLPPDHVARLLAPDEDATLVRIEGRCINTPAFSPPQLLNPFMPYDPGPRTRFLLQAERVLADEAIAVSGALRVTVQDGPLDLAPGQRVRLAGRLYRIQSSGNPGEPDWARHARNQGLYAGLFVPDAELVAFDPAPVWSLASWTHWLRGKARAALHEPLADDETARPLVEALVLGTRSAVTDDLNDAFMRTGAIHLLSVSGFHVAALGGTAWLVLTWLAVWLGRRWERRVAAAGTALILLVYFLLAETNAPILRAMVMGWLLCLQQWLRRPTNTLNALAASALLILLMQPLELFRAGFQLSFLQVLALVLLVGPVWRSLIWLDPDSPRDVDTYARLAWRLSWRFVAAAFVFSLGLWAVSVPLVAFHFQMFGPWSALQSVLVSPPAAGVVLFGFAVLSVGWVPVIGWLAHRGLELSTWLLLTPVQLLSRIPGTKLDTPVPPLWLVLATYGLLALWLSPIGARIVRRRRVGSTVGNRHEDWRNRLPQRATVAVIVTVAVWAGFVLWPRSAGDGTLRAYVLDVGHGSATLVVSPDGNAWLADIGTLANRDVGRVGEFAAKALQLRRYDAVSISHANLDHFSGIPELTERVPIGELWSNPFLPDDPTPHVAKLRASLAAGLTVAPLQRGDVRTLGGMAVHVLHPAPDAAGAAANDQSLVLRYEALGRRILVPGDVESPAMRELLARCEQGKIDLAADVLVAPHHGSVEPEIARFLEEVGPEVIVISAGADRPEFTRIALEVLGGGVRVFNTHRSGAVQVELGAAGPVRVETGGPALGEAGKTAPDR